MGGSAAPDARVTVLTLQGYLRSIRGAIAAGPTASDVVYQLECLWMVEVTQPAASGQAASEPNGSMQQGSRASS
jgi:hypothetical protein